MAEGWSCWCLARGHVSAKRKDFSAQLSVLCPSCWMLDGGRLSLYIVPGVTGMNEECSVQFDKGNGVGLARCWTLCRANTKKYKLPFQDSFLPVRLLFFVFILAHRSLQAFLLLLRSLFPRLIRQPAGVTRLACSLGADGSTRALNAPAIIRGPVGRGEAFLYRNEWLC